MNLFAVLRCSQCVMWKQLFVSAFVSQRFEVDFEAYQLVDCFIPIIHVTIRPIISHVHLILVRFFGLCYLNR